MYVTFVSVSSSLVYVLKGYLPDTLFRWYSIVVRSPFLPI
jgi:hypothetical protein